MINRSRGDRERAGRADSVNGPGAHAVLLPPSPMAPAHGESVRLGGGWHRTYSGGVASGDVSFASGGVSCSSLSSLFPAPPCWSIPLFTSCRTFFSGRKGRFPVRPRGRPVAVARFRRLGFDGSVSRARLPLLGCSRPPCPPGIEPSGSGRAPERKGTPPGRASLRSGRSRVKGVRDWGRSGPGQRQNPATYWTPAPASAPAVVARALTASLSTDVQPDTWMAPSAVGVSVTRPVSGSR